MGTFGLVFDQGKERDVVVLGQVFEEIVGADLATTDEWVREIWGEHQDFHSLITAKRSSSIMTEYLLLSSLNS